MQWHKFVANNQATASGRSFLLDSKVSRAFHWCLVLKTQVTHLFTVLSDAQGFYPDFPNIYVEVSLNESKARISMDMIPTW